MLLKHACNISIIIIIIFFQETGQILVEQDDFRLRTPDIIVSASDTKLRVNQPFTATFTLKNPLPINLTNAVFNVEGAGVQRKMAIKIG